jgi:hypothetical protein
MSSTWAVAIPDSSEEDFPLQIAAPQRSLFLPTFVFQKQSSIFEENFQIIPSKYS